MRYFKRVLVLSMIISMFAGVVETGNIVRAASVTHSLVSTTVTPGYYMRWYPTDNVPGYYLVNGGTQKMYFKLGEKGDKISIGFMKYSTKTNYGFYTGTLSGTTKSVSGTLMGATAYYQPYLKNRNETVYIKVKSSSYITVS